ncbi:MAG: hypothetical protein H0X68_07215 [Chloroflexi bacterium]|nr:hypothetical protein [Chloroflexota bacterium]
MPSPDRDAVPSRRPGSLAVRVLALGLFAVTVAMLAYALASLVLPGAELMPDHPSLPDFLLFSLIFISFPAVGLVVSWQRPENPIGWIFLAIGLLMVGSVFAAEYAGRVLHVGWVLPAYELVAWTGDWTWFVATGLALTFAVLLFPDGRLPGTRWRPVAWFAAFAIVGTMMAQAVGPGDLDGYEGAIANPFGLDGRLSDATDAIAAGGFVAILVAGLLSVASLVVRFRRARGVERQQIKGLLYPVCLFLVAQTAALVVQIDAVWLLALAGLAAIPVGAGVAILRYRLFDIDVVINRTLVYASLSVVLGMLYVGLVLALQVLLSPFTANNAPAVAISTLAVAGAFGPARRSLQSVVDRRFYRARYDAGRTIEGFAASLRDEVDIRALTAHLRTAAQRTLQPTSTSVWLRERRS